MESALRFGPFALHPARQLLLEDEQPVRLGSRALALLTALVERAGEVVGKDELVAIVWPRTVVEDSSLRVHIAALRKVLGDGQAGRRYLINEPGRGYRFVAPVERVGVTPAQAPAPMSDDARIDARMGGLPARLTRMIGRAASVATLSEQLRCGRLVTLVGPGGIGKTTMALAVAEAQTGAFEHGLCFIDLAPIGNGELVPSVLMAGLGLLPRADGLPFLENFLRERRLLVVLDNCEHLLDRLTPLVERLLGVAPGLHVLATSREPLRAEGEWLHRLGALALPPAGCALSAEQALRYPAIELFVERATASVDDFQLSDREAPVVAALCQRLDGNPLAIELAAARVDLFGVDGLAADLGAHVLQIRGDRRDAPTRHHSLATMLDWSYRLLSDAERDILNRLSVFQGWFEVRAAIDFLMASARDTPLMPLGPGLPAGGDAEAPVIDAGEVAPTGSPRAPAGTVDGATDTALSALREDELFDAIASLAAKSLLTSDISGEPVQFRLLELTRAFALAHLERTGLRAALARRHAELVLRQFERAAGQWTRGSKREWFSRHLWLIDEARAAMAWCFSDVGDAGDALTGCRLTAAVWTIGNVVNPFDHPDAIERALIVMNQLGACPPDLEMRLNIAMASKCELLSGRTAEAAIANARALELAAQFDSPAYAAETLMAIAIIQMAMGEYTESAATCVQLTTAARQSGDAALMLVSERIGSQAAHFLGDNARCRTGAERVLRHPLPRGPMGTISGGLDHRVSMRIMLSRTLWIEGLPDQAAELAEETLVLAGKEDALAQTQTYSMCLCAIALWRGDAELARERIASFRSLGAVHLAGGVWLPTSALIPWWRDEDIADIGSPLQRDHLMTAYPALVTDQAAARALSGAAGWCGAELLRGQGERLLREASPQAEAAARARFEHALALARKQRGRGWELRAATSLARLLRRQGNEAEARAVLEPVHEGFTEGFDTADLRASAALLNAM